MEAIYLAYFATFSVVTGVTLPLVIEFLNQTVNITQKFWKSVVSWGVPVAIMYVGWAIGNFFDGSFLQSLPVWQPAVYGAWAGLMANVNWANVPWLKEMVNAVMAWLLNR